MPERGTGRVIRTNSQELADAMLDAFPQLRYRPARKDGNPVRQIVPWGKRVSILVVSAPGGKHHLPPPPPARQVS